MWVCVIDPGKDVGITAEMDKLLGTLFLGNDVESKLIVSSQGSNIAHESTLTGSVSFVMTQQRLGLTPFVSDAIQRAERTLGFQQRTEHRLLNINIFSLRRICWSRG